MSIFARRLSCLLSLFLVLQAAGWARPGRSGDSGESAVSMLRQAPLESALAIGWNTRGQFDTSAALGRIRQGNPGAARALKDIDTALGTPLEALLSSISGSGFMSTAGGPNGRFRCCLVLRLDNEAPVKSWLKSRWNPALDRQGEPLSPPIWVFEDELYALVQDGWLVMGSDEMSARKALRVGRRTLAQEPMLATALQRVPADRSSIIAFSHGERMRVVFDYMLGLGYVFPNDELGFWEYAVAAVDTAKSQTDGFLSIPENGTEMRKALVRAGGFDSSVLSELPTTSAFGGFNLGWLRSVMDGLGKDSSEVAWYLGQIVGELNAYGSFSSAFPGSAGAATDAMQSGTGPSQPSSIMAARVGDATIADRFIDSAVEANKTDLTQGCVSNVKNIGTALEMYSTDWSGKYPTSLAALTPNYLWSIPKCPATDSDTYSASLQTGPNAEGNTEHYQDYYLVKCLGKNHETLEADHPQFNGIQGLILGELTNPPVAKAHDPLSAGGSRRYESDDVLVSLDGEHGLVRAATGPMASTWLSQPGGGAPPARVLEAARWAGPDLLGLLYLDYKSGQKSASAMLRTLHDNEAELMAALMDEMVGQDSTLEDLHVLRTSPDGLIYRGQGLSSSRALGASGLVAVAILYPNFVRAREQGQLTACKSNLKNIGTACEMWSTDNRGKYPTTLAALTPDYLRAIPQCPSAGTDTYSASLQTGPDAEGNTEHYQDYYIVKCLGHNHGDLAEPDYPQYNGIQGLIERDPNY